MSKLASAKGYGRNSKLQKHRVGQPILEHRTLISSPHATGNLGFIPYATRKPGLLPSPQEALKHYLFETFHIRPGKAV